MIEYVGRKKPNLDERAMHIRLIDALIKSNRYKRIGIFGLPDDGKTTIIKKIEYKYKDTEWNIFEDAVFFHDPEGSISNIPEPFVYVFFDVNISWLPKFDIIYTMQYSKEYKEAISGIRFTDGIWRPMGEYMRYCKYYHWGQNDMRGKKIKNMEELRKFVA